MGNTKNFFFFFINMVSIKALFSFYEGHIPVLVTSDVDIIQEVFIKQYGNFSARKVKNVNIIKKIKL